MTFCSSDPAPLKAENTLKVEEEKNIGERVKQPIQIHWHGAVAEKFVNGSATEICKQTERNKMLLSVLWRIFTGVFMFTRARDNVPMSLKELDERLCNEVIENATFLLSTFVFCLWNFTSFVSKTF